MIIEELTVPKWKPIKICLSVMLLFFIFKVAPVQAAEGSSRLDQGVNDNATGHESRVQTAAEVIGCAIFLRVLAYYKIP